MSIGKERFDNPLQVCGLHSAVNRLFAREFPRKARILAKEISEEKSAAAGGMGSAARGGLPHNPRAFHAFNELFLQEDVQR